MSLVALIDYGAGNLRSVENALNAASDKKNKHIVVTSDPQVVARAERIVLPGVGAFAHCMRELGNIPGMIDALSEAVLAKQRPFLGICVGMQLMADEGHEHGVTPGLGWIAGTVAPIAATPGLKVPHMGWNVVEPTQAHPVIAAGEAYFLHGYAFEGDGVIATTEHGVSRVAAIAQDNMVGVQFHPEKSQAYGLGMLRRFLAWQP